MPLGLLREVALFTVTQCAAPDSAQTTLLATTRYVGPLLTLLMYVVGLRYKELYLLLFGLGLSLDGYTNVAWRYVLRDDARVVATCGDAYVPFASPSYQAQHTAFFVTFALTYIGLYRPRAKLWHFLLLAVFALAVFYADRELNYHTERALLAGAYIGALNAVVWQVSAPGRVRRRRLTDARAHPAPCALCALSGVSVCHVDAAGALPRLHRFAVRRAAARPGSCAPGRRVSRRSAAHLERHGVGRRRRAVCGERRVVAAEQRAPVLP